MRIALATYELPTVRDDDLDFLIPALKRRGAEVETPAWTDAKADWASFDLVMVSSTWDYFRRLDEFRAWLRKTAKATLLRNDLETIAWSLDKRYLTELEAAGVPTIPTIWTAPGSEEEIERTVAELGWARRDPEAGRRSRRAAPGPGRDADGRPDPALAERGRDGAAVPAGGADRGRAQPDPHRRQADPRRPQGSGARRLPGAVAVRRLASSWSSPRPRRSEIAAAAIAVAPGEPLYARADLIRDESGALRLIELELVEPNLFLGLDPGAAETLARALLAEL